MACFDAWFKSDDRAKVFYAGAVLLSLAMIQQERLPASVKDRKRQPEDPRNPHSVTGTQRADLALSRISRPLCLPSPADSSVLVEHRRFHISTLVAFGYYGSLAYLTCLVDSALGLQSTTARAVAYVTVSLGLAPVHAVQTHAMILRVPPSLWDLKHRLSKCVSAHHYKVLLLPTILHSGFQMMLLTAIIANMSSARASTEQSSLTQFVRILATVAVPALVAVPTSATVLTLVEADMMLKDDVATVSHQRGILTPERTFDGGRSVYFRPSMGALRLVRWTRLGSIAVLYFKWWIALLIAPVIAIC